MPWRRPSNARRLHAHSRTIDQQPHVTHCWQHRHTAHDTHNTWTYLPPRSPMDVVLSGRSMVTRAARTFGSSDLSTAIMTLPLRTRSCTACSTPWSALRCTRVMPQPEGTRTNTHLHQRRRVHIFVPERHSGAHQRVHALDGVGAAEWAQEVEALTGGHELNGEHPLHVLNHVENLAGSIPAPQATHAACVRHTVHRHYLCRGGHRQLQCGTAHDKLVMTYAPMDTWSS